MRRLLVLLVFICFSPACKAAQMGAVHLQGLWGNSLVYVDGKPVEVKNGAIEVLLGTHQLQIEQFEWPENKRGSRETPNISGVYVFRACIEVVTDKKLEIVVQPLPVYSTLAGSLSSVWVSYGAIGPMGPPGQPADMQKVIDAEVAYQLLRDALIFKMNYLRWQCRLIEKQDPAIIVNALPRFYWNGPKQVLAKEHYMVCVPAPPGRVGPQGISGDVKRLKSADGQLLLSKALNTIDFEVLAKRLREAEASPQPKLPQPEDLVPAIPIYTSRWKNHLEAEATKFSFVKQKPVSLGYNAPEGPEGPPGLDGQVPNQPNAEVHFSSADTEALLLRLTRDVELQGRVGVLKKRIDQLQAPKAPITVLYDGGCLPPRPLAPK